MDESCLADAAEAAAAAARLQGLDPERGAVGSRVPHVEEEEGGGFFGDDEWCIESEREDGEDNPTSGGQDANVEDDDADENGEEGAREAEGEGDSEPDVTPAEQARRFAFGQQGARTFRRRNAEASLGPDGKVPVTYLSDLFASPRYKEVDSSYRYAACFMAIHHFETALDDDDDEGALPPSDPPLLSRERRIAKRGQRRFRSNRSNASVCYGGDGCSHHPPCHGATAAPGEAVPSRGRVGNGSSSGRTSPSSELHPAAYKDKADKDDSISSNSKPHQANFSADVAAHLRCVLQQYDTPKERISRCRREQLLLALAVGKPLDRIALPARRRASGGSSARDARDRADWQVRFRHELLSDHLTDQLVVVTDRFDKTCYDLLHVKPGEQLQRDVHGLESVDPAHDANPMPLLVMEKCWGKRAEPGYPLGRVYRPASDARRKQLSRERARERRRGSKPVREVRGDGGGGSEEVSSVSGAEVEAVAAGGGQSGGRAPSGLFPPVALSGGVELGEEDATQPTQDAAAAPEMQLVCTYCSDDGAALWRCQICAVAGCHSHCCEPFVRAAFFDGCVQHIC